ncbi:MAG TPA: extracellular solute-binding protein [Candidatus Paenibacillus intestinavium]|nr:extracellular solute-binding protein [Candidatus Paenibacillus intestinavium]
METIRELTIWHEFNGEGDTSIEVLEDICQSFSEQYGIGIKLEVMSIAQLGESIKDIHETGEGPHMAFVPSDMSSYKKLGRYSIVRQELCNDIISEHILQSMQYEGEQVGVPIITGNHLVLFYNKDFYDMMPSSWEEIVALDNKEKDQNIIPIAVDLKQSYSFIPYLTSFSGWPMRDGRPDLDTQEMKAALSFVQSQKEVGHLVSLDGATALLGQFIEGKVGAIITGEWIFNYLERKMGKRLGVGNLPTINGRISTSMSSSVGIVFPNQSLASVCGQHIQQFIRFMLNDENQMKWADRVQRIPASSVVMEQLKNKDNPNLQMLINMLNTCIPIPVSPYMIAAWIGMDAGLSELEHGQANEAHRMMVSTAVGIVEQIEQFLNEQKEEQIL